MLQLGQPQVHLGNVLGQVFGRAHSCVAQFASKHGERRRVHALVRFQLPHVLKLARAQSAGEKPGFVWGVNRLVALEMGLGGKNFAAHLACKANRCCGVELFVALQVVF